MICNKDLVLFLFPHTCRIFVLYFCWNCLSEVILTNIQNIIMLLEVLMQYSCPISHNCHPWVKVSWHSNCHYNKFCHCIKCRIKRVDCIFLIFPRKKDLMFHANCLLETNCLLEIIGMNCQILLTLTVLWANSAWQIDDNFLIFPENRIWHFMQIVF